MGLHVIVIVFTPTRKLMLEFEYFVAKSNSSVVISILHKSTSEKARE